MATRKQKAAARRNIKKAIAANRRRGKKGHRRSKGRRVTKTGTKKLRNVKRNLARATKALKSARALL